MNWYTKRLAMIRSLSAPLLALFVTVKFLAGVALGLLLAIWLPTGIWWIILVLSLLLSIPLLLKFFKQG